MRVCGIGTLGQAAFIATLALWPLLGCGGGSSSVGEQSSSGDTRQPGQREQSGAEEATSGDARFSAENLHKLDRTIARVRKDKNLPGVLVGVSVPGEGEYVSAQGSANLDTGTKPQPSDQFRVGSVTKTFVATAILQLVEEGQLRKSDTLSRCYRDFPNADEITVDDLLRMRSGIPHYWTEETLKHYYDNPQQNVTNEDIIEATAAKADQFEPPDWETEYSDTNYNILGAVLEKVSGNDIATQLDQSIISPLGLENTYYPTDDELPGDLHGYGLDPNSGELEDKTILNPAPSDGAGAMISDMSDLAIWSRALYKGDLLTSKTQQARLEVQRGEGVSESSGYGEGISKLGTLWGHGGTIAGFSTDMWYLPEEDATIVISVNRCDETYVNRSNYVLIPVLQSLFPKTVKDL